MSYRLPLTAEQIDIALQVAYALAANAGIPVADGEHAVAFQRLEHTLSGLADRVPSSAAVDAAIRAAASLRAILRFCGSVEDAAVLPKTAKNGDTYVIRSTGQAYAWDGAWQPCGNITLSGVQSVNGVAADPDGAVVIDATNVKTLSGKTVEESIQGKQDRIVAGDGISIDGEIVSELSLPCNPNLLDNANFGDPVNQRGVSGAITTPGYFIDRWKLESGSVTVENGCITLDGTICQLFPYNPQYPYTSPTVATVLSENGIDDVVPEYTTENGIRKFRISAHGVKLYCAKLEIGHAQTLAHQSGGKWYPNGTRKYVEELMQCKRFLTAIDNSNWGMIGTGYAIDDNTIWGYFPVQFKMWGNPVISDDSGSNWAIGGGGKSFPPTKAEYLSKRDNCIVLKFTVSGAVKNTAFIIRCVSKQRIWLSCEP